MRKKKSVRLRKFLNFLSKIEALNPLLTELDGLEEIMIRQTIHVP